MNSNSLAPGMIVKVLDFVGVIMAVNAIGDELLVTLDSPKRIALHQTSLDILDYNLLPDVWSEASAIELLADVERYGIIGLSDGNTVGSREPD